MTTPGYPNEEQPATTAAPPSYTAQPPSYPAQQQSYQAQQPAAPRPALPTTLAQTNAFALVSVVLAFIQPIAGIVFGHMALSQIKRTGDAGRGLALTGVIVGYAWFAFLVVFIIFYVSIIALAIGSAGAMFSDFGGDYGYSDDLYGYDY